MDEALRIMGVFGYQGLSVKDVATRCSLTKQGVMHYFPTKEQLLFALLNERDASMEADMLALFAQSQSEAANTAKRKRAIFEECLAAFVESLVRSPGLIKLHVVLRAEATNPEHPAKEYFTQRDQSTLEWLTQRAREFSKDAKSTARLIMAVMIGLQAQWVQEEQAFDLVEEWKKALHTILH